MDSDVPVAAVVLLQQQPLADASLLVDSDVPVLAVVLLQQSLMIQLLCSVVMGSLGCCREKSCAAR
ncbi:hypothetical protein LGT39_09215 [Demequina sp. TTPB684]|uniref:hypothetical protein n=1 Tax=unclassified Demequina TaxID=2620311 RepID=UPI001CF4FA05|nr:MULTISPECIES: hypothetical protein [unclassified Demequina]MCB2413022.1 hypothetical protein [Demequina sp. TTPB684]UPU87090.1 hypothetical protein LGT36_007295 [Demequina sp. TMPB413]